MLHKKRQLPEWAAAFVQIIVLPGREPWNSVATTAAAAGSAALSFSGLVHVERTPIEFLAAECFDGGIAFIVASHRHESKAAGAASFAVSNDGNFLNCAVCGKSVTKCVFSRIKIQISYVQPQSTVSKTSNNQFVRNGASVDFQHEGNRQQTARYPDAIGVGTEPEVYINRGMIGVQFQSIWGRWASRPIMRPSAGVFVVSSGPKTPHCSRYHVKRTSLDLSQVLQSKAYRRDRKAD